MVSSASVTGSTSGFGNETTDYFRRIHEMDLKNPQIVGFGIKTGRLLRQQLNLPKVQ